MVLKRLEDIIFSLAILTLISPILLIISLCVKLTLTWALLFSSKPVMEWDGETNKSLEI